MTIARRIIDYPRKDESPEETHRMVIGFINEVGLAQLAIDYLVFPNLTEKCLNLIGDFTIYWDNAVEEIKKLMPDFFIKLQQIYITS